MPTGVGATWGEDNVQQASGGTRSNEGNTGSTVLIHCGEQSCLIAFGGRGMFILRAGTACVEVAGRASDSRGGGPRKVFCMSRAGPRVYPGARSMAGGADRLVPRRVAACAEPRRADSIHGRDGMLSPRCRGREEAACADVAVLTKRASGFVEECGRGPLAWRLPCGEARGSGSRVAALLRIARCRGPLARRWDGWCESSREDLANGVLRCRLRAARSWRALGFGAGSPLG